MALYLRRRKQAVIELVLFAKSCTHIPVKGYVSSLIFQETI
jgi:hypothetical protein